MGVLFLKILVPYKTAPFKFLKYDTIKGYKLEFIHTIRFTKDECSGAFPNFLCMQFQGCRH